jgi:hypothetical protein
MLKKPARAVCLVSLVHLVCFVDLVHLVSFVQPKNQTNQTNQINKNGGGDYSLGWGGMALIISAASSLATSFR